MISRSISRNQVQRVQNGSLMSRQFRFVCVALLPIIVSTFSITSNLNYKLYTNPHVPQYVYGNGNGWRTHILSSSNLLNSVTNTAATNDRKISKYETEFVAMVEEFCEYSDKDIAGVENYRYRALYDGVKTSRDEPEVTRAFVVLYEEIVPLRLAGRMIHKHLKSVMAKSQEKQKLVEENILKSTKLTSDEIFEGRKAFLQLDSNDDGQLSVDELVESGIIDTTVQLLGFESFDFLVKKLYENEDDRLDFEMFMIRLQKCAEDSNVEGCNISTVLDQIIKRMEVTKDAQQGTSKDQRKLKYGQRYDEMVASFSEWKDLVPEGDGRMVEVLKGCFAGANNEKIVYVRFLDIEVYYHLSHVFFWIKNRLLKLFTRTILHFECLEI